MTLLSRSRTAQPNAATGTRDFIVAFAIGVAAVLLTMDLSWIFAVWVLFDSL